MRTHFTSLAIVLAAALAACFGSGPVPGRPSGATPVFVAPVPTANACNDSVYISSVGFSPTSGYAVLMPYVPSNGNCNGGAQTNGLAMYSFDKAGGSPQGVNIGPAGNSTQVGPAIAANANTVVWGYGNQVTNGSANANVNVPPQGSIGVLGLALGAATVFVAGNVMNGGGGGGFSEEPWNPQWPCCGMFGNQGSPGAIVSLPLPLSSGNLTATTLSSASLFCDELKHCIVGNTAELYYMRRGDVAMGYTAAIDRIVKPNGPVTTLDTVSTSLSPSATPVGLAATETHVAWAVANSGTQSGGNGQLQPGCWIFARSLAEQSGRLLFQSSRFSCLDVAVDGGSVYFTIVASSTNNDCNSCQPPIHGLGIGRVSLDGSKYESLATTIAGQFEGPRRIFLDMDGVSMYVVDPLVIAKLPKSALDGKQEIPQ